MPKNAPELEEKLTSELKELGARVKRLREFRRLTLQVVAEAANIGVQTLVRIEEGSPGVALLNLQKVLTVLNAPATFVDVTTPPSEERPGLPQYVGSEAVQARIKKAAQAAAQELDKLGRKDGVAVADERFMAALERRLSELLCGDAGRPFVAGSVTTKLLYSDSDVGGPMSIEGEQPAGWVLRMRNGRQLLARDGSVVAAGMLDSGQLHASRTEALAALGELIESKGHTPGPVDAVPAFQDESGYRF